MLFGALTTREIRFIRYTTIGVSTFGIDLLLLWFFIDAVGMHYLTATAVAFLMAVSLNYVLSRRWVFRHSKRGLAFGYVYFLKFALIGMALTTGLMWAMVENSDLAVVVVRVLIAGLVGMGNYLANLYLNFKVAGKALD
jgi:putative flippase GtrA